MSGLSSIVIGLALLVLAFATAYAGGSMLGALAFAAAALFLFARGFMGRGVTSADDVTLPMDFVSDPAGTLVDAGIDRLGELLGGQSPAAIADKPFDPDAIIARHLEARGTPPAAEPVAARGFGRKGL